MIGIVILNYGSWDASKKCIESILEHPPADPYRIILVDNASPVGPEYDLEDLLRRYQVHYLENPKNLGYNAGNNTGIKKALELGCEDILISNNDVYFQDNAIQIMEDCIKQDPEVGIVGPKIVDRNGQIQRDTIFRRTGLKEKYFVRTRLNALFRHSHPTSFGFDRDYEKRQEDAYSVLGCCFMMSGECIRKVAPLDEYPFLYEEELILGIRMEQAGLKTVYEPSAEVLHLHGESTGKLKAFSYAHNIRSEIYYCREYLHAKKWQVYPLYWYRVFLYLVRCLPSRDFRKRLRWFFKLTGDEFAEDKKW